MRAPKSFMTCCLRDVLITTQENNQVKQAHSIVHQIVNMFYRCVCTNVTNSYNTNKTKDSAYSLFKKIVYTPMNNRLFKKP
jgi:hypothetical protein